MVPINKYSQRGPHSAVPALVGCAGLAFSQLLTIAETLFDQVHDRCDVGARPIVGVIAG